MVAWFGADFVGNGLTTPDLLQRKTTLLHLHVVWTRRDNFPLKFSPPPSSHRHCQSPARPFLTPTDNGAAEITWAVTVKSFTAPVWPVGGRKRGREGKKKRSCPRGRSVGRSGFADATQKFRFPQNVGGKQPDTGA